MRGSQGQHLTAYVAFTDMILSHVRDRTPRQAANALIDLLDSMSDLLGGEQWNRTYGATVEENKRLLRDAARDNDADIVGGVIDNILALRNVMPDTALATAERHRGTAKPAPRAASRFSKTPLRTDADLPRLGHRRRSGESGHVQHVAAARLSAADGASETQFNKTKNRSIGTSFRCACPIRRRSIGFRSAAHGC